jgi:hypothetical protein
MTTPQVEIVRRLLDAGGIRDVIALKGRVCRGTQAIHVACIFRLPVLRMIEHQKHLFSASKNVLPSVEVEIMYQFRGPAETT